ncbi:MAG: hypothetical protein ACPIOQ_29820, partial [Promethearchaeia archaeon]
SLKETAIFFPKKQNGGDWEVTGREQKSTAKLWECRVTKRQHGTALHGTGRGVLDRTGRTDAASRRAASAQTGLSVARSASCFAKLSRADTCFCSDSPRTCL